MKAFTSLLAVLLMLSFPSLGQALQSQQAAAGGGSSQPEAAGQSSTPSPSPTAATPSPEAAAEGADIVPAVPFGPGAKIFLERTNGFEALLSNAIVQKKVPVVLVKERAEADFMMSGEAHLKKTNFITGMVLSTSGGANVSIKDARTGNQVFACNFRRVDGGEREGDLYYGWAGQCAGHLKKAMKKK